MSKTLFVDYQGEGFWAYDVGVGVFLKYLIDRASLYLRQHESQWLADCVSHWRVNAVISEYGLHLDSAWSKEQRDLIHVLIAEACQELEARDWILAEEAASWDILDGKGVYTRGASRVSTAPAVELGRAIGLLVEGALPPAPNRTWWLYGTPDGRSTLQKRAEP